MTKNSLERQLIAEELKRTNGNVSKVSRALGLNYYTMREEQRAQATMTFVRATEPEPYDIRTLGRGRFKPYVIAVKPRGTGWPSKYASAIKEARRKFDAGTHDMYQTVNGGWVVQYLIPLLNQRESTKFFAGIPNP